MSCLLGYHKVPKAKVFFFHVTSLNCACILLWCFNVKIRKTKDTPFTLLCTQILELPPPPCALVPELGISFGMWGSVPAGRATVLLPWICSAHEWWIWCSREVQERNKCTMYERQSQGRGFVCPPEPSLGAEWGKWVLTKNRDQAELKSQTQAPKYTLGIIPWHWVWDQSLRNHPLPTFGNWSTEALNDLSDTGNLEDSGALPFIEVSVWCFTINPRLFSEQFSQGLALCVAGFYCNRVGLKIMTFFFWKCDSSKGEALHMCRWRNENVQPENRCLFSHTFCFA